MYPQKLCLSLNESFGLPVNELIPRCRAVGFEGFFAVWKDAAFMATWAATAKACGLEISSMHAPFRQAAVMWEGPDEAAEAGTRELIACVEDCARHEVPVMVAHAYIGFADKPHIITPEGLARYERVLRAAEGTGVKVAFENTEGEEFLAALFEHFGAHPNIGYCWDCGHEACFNRSQDMLARYGKWLAVTHLHDNFGIRAADGSLTPLDDLHLIPGDGALDWTALIGRLAATGFAGPLTFELKRKARTGQRETDRYWEMSLDQYLAAAHTAAARLADALGRLGK